MERNHNYCLNEAAVHTKTCGSSTFKGGMIVSEGLVASISYCQNNREIDLNWILMFIKANTEIS